MVASLHACQSRKEQKAVKGKTTLKQLLYIETHRLFLRILSVTTHTHYQIKQAVHTEMLVWLFICQWKWNANGGFVPSDILDTSHTSLTELRPASHRLHHALVCKEGCVRCEWVDWVPPERADWGGRSHPGNGALSRVAVCDHQRMCLSGCVLLFIYYFHLLTSSRGMVGG